MSWLDQPPSDLSNPAWRRVFAVRFLLSQRTLAQDHAIRAGNLAMPGIADIDVDPSLSDIALQSAELSETQELLDRTRLVLDDMGFKRFLEGLEMPSDNEAALQRLLSRRAPWEKDQ